MGHGVVGDLLHGDKVGGVGVVLEVIVGDNAGDDAVVGHVDDADAGAVHIAAEPVEEFGGLGVAKLEAVEGGAAGVVDVIICVAGDAGVEIKARGGHAVDELAGLAVEDAQKAAAVALGGHGDAPVGQADHTVDVAVDADLIGVLPIEADGAQALAVGDDDVALAVNLHVVGLEPPVLRHVDGGGGQLVALAVEGADVVVLLELLVGEVFLGIHGVIAVTVVPGGIGRRLVDVVLAFVLGLDALGDVFADLFPLAEVEAVVAVAADADEVGAVFRESAVFGSVYIFGCGGRLGGTGGGAAAAAGAAAGAERKAQCQHEKQAYDILHFGHCKILLDGVLVLRVPL